MAVSVSVQIGQNRVACIPISKTSINKLFRSHFSLVSSYLYAINSQEGTMYSHLLARHAAMLEIYLSHLWGKVV